MKISPLSLTILGLHTETPIRWSDYLEGKMCHSQWINTDHFWYMIKHMDKMGLSTLLFRCEDWNIDELFNFADQHNDMLGMTHTIWPSWPDSVNGLDSAYITVKLN